MLAHHFVLFLQDWTDSISETSRGRERRFRGQACPPYDADEREHEAGWIPRAGNKREVEMATIEPENVTKVCGGGEGGIDCASEAAHNLIYPAN